MKYSEQKRCLLGYEFKRIDKNNKKYEYSCGIKSAVSDLWHNEHVEGIVNIIISDIHTRFSISNGWTTYPIVKTIKVEIDNKTKKWRRFLKSGKTTKWTTIKRG